MILNQSQYLKDNKPKLQELIKILNEKYQYTSVLATDVGGTSYLYSQKQRAINPYRFSEKGFVVRVYLNGTYQEYSFNKIDDVKKTAEEIIKQLDKQNDMLKDLQVEQYETPLIEEEEIKKEFASKISDNIYTTSKEDIMAKLKTVSDKYAAKDNIVEARVVYSNVIVNKMFLSAKRDLMQSFGYSLSVGVLLAHKDGKINALANSASGFKGIEIIDEVASGLDATYEKLMKLFDASHIVPGEYEVICCPDATGLIAHEAFGHGLEMDMFVKNRAIAKYHMQEKIASDITDMYDGTDKVEDTASYNFDDEGVISSTTQILKSGYLVNGMNDLLSAMRLNIAPTGNGRRESFERKAYTRMTNTYFGKGNSTLDEMIASVKYGFLISNGQSGMEDPKHWGIQCVLSCAEEIEDGKLTGKMFTPVILTGYVPDLLANISMIGTDIKTNGNGMCGKGYKEWVVVSDGGPYIKTKVRLG